MKFIMVRRYIHRLKVDSCSNINSGRNGSARKINGTGLSTHGLGSAFIKAGSGLGSYKGVPIIQRTVVKNASAKLSRMPMRMEKRVVSQSILAAYKKAEVEGFKYKTFGDFYKEVLVHFRARQSHVKHNFIPNKNSVSRVVNALSQMGLVK